MTASPTPELTAAQQCAAADLCRLADEHPELTIVAAPVIEGTDLVCRIAIDTTAFPRGVGGLKVQPSEQIALIFTKAFPVAPPHARVEHLRWLGYPHVLEGRRLCLFLDPEREWSPRGGMAESLQRLWEWLEDAIGGRFDSSTALYHGFGGVTTTTPGAPFLVVNHSPNDLRPGIQYLAIQQRAAHRLDLAAWSKPMRVDQIPGLIVVSAQPLRGGLPRTLRGIMRAISSPLYAGWTGPTTGFPTEEMIRFRLERLVHGWPSAQQLVLMVAAPNLAVTGPGAYDLAAALLSAGEVTEMLADPKGSPNGDAELRFLRVDDVRPDVTVRRDDRRPTNWFTDRVVEIWGCGALGSWIAELLVRAGVGRLRIRDHAPVTRGLLVRQNYTDADVGLPKAEALAARLRMISPEADIVALGSAFAAAADGLDVDCDLLLDATVSAPVASILDIVANGASRELLISQVATDSSSATLGLVTLVQSGRVPSEVDHAIRDHVLDDAELEAFRVLWDPEEDDLLTPARGCSTPTFRGSAADVMGIASSIVSVLGSLGESGKTGAQLIRLPHSPSTAPALSWVPVC